MLPERSQFPSQDAYTHTALHELRHATGHPSRLNRLTLVEHGGFGTEAYAREELTAEIAAMMIAEQLGVGHELRRGGAYVGWWIKALENNPKEIRVAAVDAQRISDWLISREREWSLGEEQAKHERLEGGPGRMPERDRERPPRGVPEVGDASQPPRDVVLRDLSRSAPTTNPVVPGDRQRGVAPSRRSSGRRFDLRPPGCRRRPSGVNGGDGLGCESDSRGTEFSAAGECRRLAACRTWAWQTRVEATWPLCERRPVPLCREGRFDRNGDCILAIGH